MNYPDDGVTVEPHASCKYAVLVDYTIWAVHAVHTGDPCAPIGPGATVVLASRQMMSSGGAHVWGPPTWLNAADVIAFCQTTEAATKYRTYIREQDMESEGA